MAAEKNEQSLKEFVEEHYQVDMGAEEIANKYDCDKSDVFKAASQVGATNRDRPEHLRGFFTIKEALPLIDDESRHTLYKWCRNGIVRAEKFQNKWLIDPYSLPPNKLSESGKKHLREKHNRLLSMREASEKADGKAEEEFLEQLQKDSPEFTTGDVRDLIQYASRHLRSTLENVADEVVDHSHENYPSDHFVNFIVLFLTLSLSVNGILIFILWTG